MFIGHIELGDKWVSEVGTLALRITKGISHLLRGHSALISAVDFLKGSTIPDPASLSDTANEMLTIAEKPTK